MVQKYIGKSCQSNQKKVDKDGEYIGEILWLKNIDSEIY